MTSLQHFVPESAEAFRKLVVHEENYSVSRGRRFVRVKLPKSWRPVTKRLGAACIYAMDLFLWLHCPAAWSLYIVENVVKKMCGLSAAIVHATVWDAWKRLNFANALAAAAIFALVNVCFAGDISTIIVVKLKSVDTM